MLSLHRHSVHVVKVLWNSKGFVNAAVVKGKLLLCPRLDGENVVWKQKSKCLFDGLWNDVHSLELNIAHSEWDYGDILRQCWWLSEQTICLTGMNHMFLQHPTSRCFAGWVLVLPNTLIPQMTGDWTSSRCRLGFDSEFNWLHISPHFGVNFFSIQCW